jgi:hypothetical protein
VLGGPLPGGLAPAAAVWRTFARGFAPSGPSPGPSPGPHSGPAVLTVTAFPAPGTLTPISGRLTNVAAPASHVVAMYLQAPDSTWWVKPLPNTPITIAADGTFTTTTWASYPAGDVNFVAVHLYVLPVGTPIPVVLGAGLPAALTPLAVAQGRYARGYVAGTASSPIDADTGAADAANGRSGAAATTASAQSTTLSAPIIIGIAVAAAGVVGTLAALVTGYWVWGRRAAAADSGPVAGGGSSVGARRPGFANPGSLQVGGEGGGTAAAAPARSTTARQRRTPAVGGGSAGAV